MMMMMIIIIINLKYDGLFVPGTQEKETNFCWLERKHDDMILVTLGLIAMRLRFVRLNADKFVDGTWRTQQLEHCFIIGRLHRVP